MIADTGTVLFGVFGNPVAQSMSPVMHNRAMEALGINGVYLAFRVQDIGRGVAAVRELGIRGVSVTIPHKVSVMEHLDEVDEVGRAMGAVNTVVNEDGRLTGTNTDGLGAVRALEEMVPLQGRSVLILGSGGAARAIGFAVKSHGGEVTIANREEDGAEAEALAKELGRPFVLLPEIAGLSPDVLVNATPVGMGALKDRSPVDRDFLKSNMAVMDIVYNPLETRLLAEARAAGCKTVNGAAMFVYQGAAQFELWHKKDAPVDVMRAAVYEALEKKA